MSGRVVDGLSMLPEEREVLFAAGTRFEITSGAMEPTRGQLHFTMRELPK